MAFDLERVQARIAGMSERQLLDWLGVALPGMQRHLEAYERTHDVDHLGELVIAETTANLVVTQLMLNRFPGVDEPRVAPSALSEPLMATTTNSARRRFWKRRGPALVQTEDTV